MTCVDTFALSATHTLDLCAQEVLDKDEPNITRRQLAGTLYQRNFALAGLSNGSILPDNIPVYGHHLGNFLNLIENTDISAKLRLHTLTHTVRYTLAQLHASAECQKALQQVSPSFASAARITSVANQHLDFPGLLERLVQIAENEKQTAAIRKEAIITFNELATNAVTTFGCKVKRTDFNPRFKAIILSSKDSPAVVGAALEHGYKNDLHYPHRSAPS